MGILLGKRVSVWRQPAAMVMFIAIAVQASACSAAMMLVGHGAKRPAATEFGLGPRLSTLHRYVATLQPEQPLKVRQLMTVRVLIVDEQGRPLEDADISIDGGMPQHGHGLPTRPRVSRNLGGGLYEIQGVRFSMGGWWEFTLGISGASGVDAVTFNLAL